MKLEVADTTRIWLCYARLSVWLFHSDFKADSMVTVETPCALLGPIQDRQHRCAWRTRHAEDSRTNIPLARGIPTRLSQLVHMIITHQASESYDRK